MSGTQNKNTQAATPETVWALLQELAQAQKETDRQIKEFRESVEKSRIAAEEAVEKSRMATEEAVVKSRISAEEEVKRINEANEKRRAEFEEEMKRYRETADRQTQQLRKDIGGMAHNQGSFAEEYFFNSFDNGKQNFFGERFDAIEKQLKGHWQGKNDEYDIVLFNHESVAIIEVKYRAHENDIAQVLRKAGTFRVMFPSYAGFKIYLGLASMSFYPELEQKCIDEGIAVIKQVGDTVVINDANLKVF